jgi:hypothetical protein
MESVFWDFPQRELSAVANSHYGVTGADALIVG